MGGGHVGEQLALFFGLCQPKPSLTFSSAPLSLQPPGRPAQPALLVPKGWYVAVPCHDVGCVTPGSVPAGWACCVLQGQSCLIETSVCALFGGAGQDPSSSTLAVPRDISTDATPERASFPCCSTAGWEETATGLCRIPAHFYFH